MRRTAVIALSTSLFLVPCARAASVIEQVSIDRASLNLSSGETVTIHMRARHASLLRLQVIDRDGFVIRTLPTSQGIAGDNRCVWDGKDDAGEVVPDEAYSFRVVADRADEYFPAARDAAMAAVDPLSYSRATATLTYALKAPSRVHVQAGTVHGAEGPVLKTIVDRQPRGAGIVAEHWNGFDESGSLYVPDLPGFAVAIAVTPLPENSVITFGNKKRSFIEYAAQRHSQSLFRRRAHAAHHAGLDVFNDVAPALTLVSDRALRLQLHMTGPTASAFARQPGKIFVFVDSKLVMTRAATTTIEPIEIPIRDDDEHVVAVNWRSDYGPVAVGVLKMRRPSEAQGASRP
ncbi:MAG TPA: FlgD immunoglobulin-like domain containing protein [Thermoanaerobaculia bacterium]|nr:FlgD immunoglobulin-like domain containing protein [Thermoanaerobaculia bacterium]